MYRVQPFYKALTGAGISLRLLGVRIFKLVDLKRDAAHYGFKPEAGYDYKAALEKTTAIVEPPTAVDQEEAPDPENGPDVIAEGPDDDIPF
jgi:hypothetical protein